MRLPLDEAVRARALGGCRYTPGVDIAELVDLAEVMRTQGLGPNGGLIYCMDYILKNIDWLLVRRVRVAQSFARSPRDERAVVADATGCASGRLFRV